MESGQIKDSQVNASSSYTLREEHHCTSGRLHNQLGHWMPRNTKRAGEWLQIDFIDRVAVTKVATQGISAVGSAQTRFVTSYKLCFSDDANSWKYFKENGEDKVRNRLFSLAVTHLTGKFPRFSPPFSMLYVVLRL